MSYGETSYIEADTVLHGVCLGCGMCSVICPTKALHSDGLSMPGSGRMPALQSTLCVHCGNCSAICPSSTILQPRFRQIVAEVREKPVHTAVFLCRNLLAITPMPLQHKDISQHCDLLAAHTSPRLDSLRPPQGARVDVVRCAHRVGPRFIDKLVEYGVRNVLLLACPERDCRYQVQNIHRIPHLEALQSVYEAYGIPVRVEMRQILPNSLGEAQGIIDAFTAQAVIA